MLKMGQKEDRGMGKERTVEWSRVGRKGETVKDQKGFNWNP